MISADLVENTAFCTVHALLVALEQRGAQGLSPAGLHRLGEARAEFTDHDDLRPAAWVGVKFTTASEGLAQLQSALAATAVNGRNAQEALASTLRMRRTRALVDRLARVMP
jgi:hypothetical protein